MLLKPMLQAEKVGGDFRYWEVIGDMLVAVVGANRRCWVGQEAKWLFFREDKCLTTVMRRKAHRSRGARLS
ncbi:hypothetical protein [Roseomonas populi]|uniref:Uncharacterized protein n=1 Tax=Roseomonas populi TaxID=3121582 RepID=A0ABT1XDM4_9PROT|nr:hypothetical protein [Roseomonas pecuniae]MCR0985846.1 hypothetical protein [Roseomonas pecuniae]